TIGHDAASVAHATLIATSALTATAGGAVVLRFPATRTHARAAVRPLATPPGAAVLALTAAGLVLRLPASRGLWLDGAPEVGYALASAALLWNQYFSVLLVLTQQAAFAMTILRGGRAPDERRRMLRGWLGSTGLIVLLVAPLAPFAPHQFHANESAVKGFEGVPSQAGAAASQQAGL